MLNKKLDRAEYESLIQYFPFLYPRNVWTDRPVEDYEYDWCLGVDELPQGWVRLFLLYCKHMRKELILHKYLDKFRFSQIKEKYGDMRLYNNGVPRDSKCLDLEYIYSHLSTYVCQQCGKPAKYTTMGWVEQLCRDCFSKACPNENLDKTYCKNGNRSYYITIISYNPSEGKTKRKIPCKQYWDEYIKCLKMSDEQFLQYVKISEED